VNAIDSTVTISIIDIIETTTDNDVTPVIDTTLISSSTVIGTELATTTTTKTPIPTTNIVIDYSTEIIVTTELSATTTKTSITTTTTATNVPSSELNETTVLEDSFSTFVVHDSTTTGEEATYDGTTEIDDINSTTSSTTTQASLNSNIGTNPTIVPLGDAKPVQGLETKYVVYITVGSIVAILVAILVIFVIIKSSKKRKTNDSIEMGDSIYKNESSIYDF
jgi:hypothetical protein